MLTLLFLTLAALGGAVAGALGGAVAGALGSASYWQGRAARAIIADAEAAMVAARTEVER